MKWALPVALFVCALSSFVQNSDVCESPDSILPSEAKKYMGSSQEKTVCGKVIQVHQTGKATFVDFGNTFPKQDFAIVIWTEDRAKFGSMPDEGLCVCATGLIKEYKRKPEIVLRDPAKWKIKHTIK